MAYFRLCPVFILASPQSNLHKARGNGAIRRFGAQPMRTLPLAFDLVRKQVDYAAMTRIKPRG